MIMVDTSGLLADLFPDQGRHAECARVLTETEIGKCTRESN